jgi:HJR/Mrr/RecB family endonuclease
VPCHPRIGGRRRYVSVGLCRAPSCENERIVETYSHSGSTPLFNFRGETTIVSGYSDGWDSSEAMSAWRNSIFSCRCPFCQIACESQNDSTSVGVTGLQEDSFSSCSRCGWWSFQTYQESLDGLPSFFSAGALLRPFKPSDPSVPIDPLAAYIQRSPQAIHTMAPAKLEELVAAIYSELLGYKVEYCSYGRPDRGIDLVVMRLENEQCLAIQVKRTRRPIELGQIHQFYGAIVDAGHREGVFVTSGKFRRGAISTADRLCRRSALRIDLIDGKRLLEFIGIMNGDRRHPRPEDCPHWKNHGYWRL